MKQNERVDTEVITPQKAVAVFAQRLREAVDRKASHCDGMAVMRGANQSSDSRDTASRFEAKVNAFDSVIQLINECEENIMAELDIALNSEVKI